MIRRALILAVPLLALLPGSAGAHALLERTEPERGAGLQSPPNEVAFFFSEPVEASFGAVRVFEANGDQVETGEIVRPEGKSDAVAVELPSDLADGTYTATYRVISADSHPVSGGFVFSVGDPGAGPAESVSELLDQSDVGPVTRCRLLGGPLARLRGDRPRRRAARLPRHRLGAGARQHS